MPKGFRGIKTRVTLVATAVFVALLALVSALQAYQVGRDMSRVLGEAQFAHVSSVADELDGKFRTVQLALIVAAKAIRPGSVADRAALRRILEGQPALQSLFDGLLVVGPDGVVLLDLPELGLRGRSAADRDYFKKTIREKAPVISEPFIGVVGQPVLVLSAPILDSRGEIAGVLAGSLNLFRPNFLGEIGARKIGKTGSFALFARDRTIILSRDSERVMTQGPAPGVSPNFDHATSGREGWEEGSNSRGLRALFSYAQLETVPWVLMSALSIDEAHAPIFAAQKRIAVFSLLLAIVLGPLLWFATDRLVRPIVSLHDAIRRIRESHGSVTEVPVEGHDEIRNLAIDFNALMKERAEATEAEHEIAHRLRMITDNIPALISYVDAEERYRYANATYRDWFGLTPKQLESKTVREVVGEDAYALREAHVKEALAGKQVSFEVQMKQGEHVRSTQVRYVPETTEGGKVVGFYILASDVSGLKRTEDMLRESEQQLSLALESSGLALFDWNVSTGDVFLSEQWGVMLRGIPTATRTTFKELEKLVHEDDKPEVGRQIQAALAGVKSHYRTEHRVRTGSGGWIWILSAGQVTARDANGRAVRFVGTNADITERKRAEEELLRSREELERAARHDSLTGLPNRRMFGDRLDQALARARRSGQWTALLCLDIDRFKQINDTMGHAAGDALLIAFAERLNGCVRESDTVARLGGDEFVILLEDLNRPEDAEAIATKVLETMLREFQVESRRLKATTSIGIACSRGASDPQELFRRADAALYAAKGAGRNRYFLDSAGSGESVTVTPKKDG